MNFITRIVLVVASVASWAAVDDDCRTCSTTFDFIDSTSSNIVSKVDWAADEMPSRSMTKSMTMRALYPPIAIRTVDGRSASTSRVSACTNECYGTDILQHVLSVNVVKLPWDRRLCQSGSGPSIHPSPMLPHFYRQPKRTRPSQRTPLIAG